MPENNVARTVHTEHYPLYCDSIAPVIYKIPRDFTAGIKIQWDSRALLEL